MKASSIAVVIVGKRYGSIVTGSSGISVTHTEYQSARRQSIPVFCLVDRDVLAYEQVFEANLRRGTVAFPVAMDNAEGTFALLREIRGSETNNGILPFGNAVEACNVLIAQLAHFFGVLLAQQANPASHQISEVLSEVTQLREEVRLAQSLPSSPPPPKHAAFVQATQFLVSDTYKQLRMFLVSISGGAVEAITDLIECESFDDYLRSKGVEPTYTDDDSLPPLHDGTGAGSRFRNRAWFLVPPSLWSSKPISAGTPEKSEVGTFAIGRDKSVTMNLTAHNYLAYCYSSIRGMAITTDDGGATAIPDE